MGVINVLDFSIANLIAAGEVVERPASVVKELIENAIDADATKITIEIKNGGISFIRITDNGCGMSHDDVPLAIKRHATSKISKKQDLYSIMTLGFRGEALAAVNAVSRLKILTKRKNEPMGTMLTSYCGKIEDIQDIGCPDGTTIIIEELFGNVPARRKFLKNDKTEAMAVSSLCEKIALSKPQIAFDLIIDNQKKFQTSGDGKLKNDIYSIFGREFAANLLEVKGAVDVVRIYGYVGTPMNIRGSRSAQIFFVNGRYVKSQTMQTALERAFANYIPKDKFPTCILNINIHPGHVDVNVHPSKLEVKFSNEKMVFDAIYYTVMDAVTKSDKRPEFNAFAAREEQKRTLINSPFISREEILEEKSVAEKQIEIPVKENPIVLPADNSDKICDDVAFNIKEEFNFPKQKIAEKAIPAPQNTPDINFNIVANKSFTEQNILKSEIEKKYTEQNELSEIKNYKYIGEIFNTYIIVQTDSEILLIDKHAAHERIIFEKLKSNTQKSEDYSQVLMDTIRVPLSTEEIAIAVDFSNEITKTGFQYTVDSRNAYISEIPPSLSENDSAFLFNSIINELLYAGGSSPMVARNAVYEKALYQTSCKMAIKGGDINGEKELRDLCDNIMRCPDITYCPHGRPIAFTVSQQNIERRFKRT